MDCSLPEPDVVMPKRTPLGDAVGVKNMKSPVPVPKSNKRAQVESAFNFTHAEIVKSFRLLTTRAGRLTYWFVPFMLTALPDSPATHVGLLTKVPFQPLPVASAAVVPLDSS